jgi:aarF domain-containing kinase
MSAALRVPLRACANPATVIGQSFKPSISTSISIPAGASFHTHSKSALHTSLVTCANTVKSWGPPQNWTNSISATAKRSFASRTSSLLSAEASSLKSNAAEVKSSPALRNYAKYLVILGLLGAGAFAFSDNVQHIYGAAQRSGRVVGTLAVCINE